MDWFRSWHDMPTDPKWRVISRKAHQRIGDVIAIWNLMMVNASSNEDGRGILRNWSDEDAAAALDMDSEDVNSIRSAMQGKVLEGDRLTGWEKRQPKRERDDPNANERAKSWRERQRTPTNATETTSNANEHTDKSREDKSREDKSREDKSREDTEQIKTENPSAPSAAESEDSDTTREALGNLCAKVTAEMPAPTPPPASIIWKSELNTAIDYVACRIHDRHPTKNTRRDIGSKPVAGLILTILRNKQLYCASKLQAAKGYITALDARHQGMCSTTQWTKEGGEFAKALSGWLAPTKGRYDQEPGPGDENPDSQLPHERRSTAAEDEAERLEILARRERNKQISLRMVG